MRDKVVQNSSQVKLKKTKVKDYQRISSFSNNKIKSVNACNDSLKSKTLNVNVVYATCGKCVFNSNHNACVSKFINDASARTKKRTVKPICARKPTRKANQSVATPHKETIASESTIQKSNSYFRMLYENTRSNLSNAPSSTNSFIDHTNHPIHRRLWMHKAHDRKPQVAV
nr:hypothetical protein [Tanacetum cinerariifolium]GEX66201.1 hypothetical protein [Tanacetum cinerariifolium]